MSIIDVIKKVSENSELAEEFYDLAEVNDVKEFIKQMDSSISDEEIENFINDNIYLLSEVSSKDLQYVVGGAMNRKFLAWPLSLLSALSVVGGLPNVSASGSNLLADTNYVAKQEEYEKTTLGAKILQKINSDDEIKKAVDKYQLDGFLKEPSETDMPNSMESRKRVFADTMEYCIDNKDKFGIKLDEKDFLSENSKAIKYDYKKFMEDTKNDKIENENPAKIWLTNGKSLQSLNAVNARLKIDPKDSKNVAVLNFANYYQPGGGVIQGCTAQEECLCRMTTLYPLLATKSMVEQFYSKHTLFARNMNEWKKSGIFNEAIYTTGVKQIKDDYGIGRVGEYVDGSTFNVITAAAPDFRDSKLKKSDIPKYIEDMKDLWRMILSIAYKNGDKHLVLGALGCGAFENDPNLVAECFYSVINETGPGGKKWAYCFENIIMPVFVANKNDKKNYDAFKKFYDKKYKPFSNKSQEELDLPSIL